MQHTYLVIPTSGTANPFVLVTGKFEDEVADEYSGEDGEHIVIAVDGDLDVLGGLTFRDLSGGPEMERIYE